MWTVCDMDPRLGHFFSLYFLELVAMNPRRCALCIGIESHVMARGDQWTAGIVAVEHRISITDDTSDARLPWLSVSAHGIAGKG